jgi:hypothetical protein
LRALVVRLEGHPVHKAVPPEARAAPERCRWEKWDPVERI